MRCKLPAWWFHSLQIVDVQYLPFSAIVFIHGNLHLHRSDRQCLFSRGNGEIELRRTMSGMGISATIDPLVFKSLYLP